MADRRTSRVLRRISIFALLLYAGTAIATPLLHAKTTRLTAPPTFESGHSTQCVPIHDEAHCPTHAARHIVPSVPTPFHTADPGCSTALPRERVSVPPDPPGHPNPSVRAPPR
jgi:hypothetical protein